MPRKQAPEPERSFGLGRLTVAVSESRYALACDRAAADAGGTLYLLSAVGDGASVQGLAAALNGRPGSPTLTPEGLEWVRPDGSKKSIGGYSTPLVRHAAGYRRHTHRLEHGRVHALLVARDPAFLPSLDPESLWQCLMGPRYTTPLLRAWAAWLTGRLARDGLLVPCHAHRARCGLLTATDAELDAIVSGGVRSGALELSEEPAAVELAAAV